MSEEWRKYVPVIDKLIWQCYYRILSFISFHGSIGEAYDAAKFLSESKGGAVYWVASDRIFRWDDAEVSPGITMNVWFFGSAIRKKNTVMCRVGWYTLGILTTALTMREKHV